VWDSGSEAVFDLCRWKLNEPLAGPSGSGLAAAGAAGGSSEGWTFEEHQVILTTVDPVVLDSARRHGIANNDMLHAYRNPIRIFEFDDLTMLVGADQAGRMLEVGVATGDGVEFIVHAMTARSKFLR